MANSLNEDDIVAVYGIEAGVHTYARFTKDRESLEEAVQAAFFGNTSSPGGVSAEIRTSLANIPSGGGVIPGVYTDEDKIALAYSADFGTLVRYPELQDLRLLLNFQDLDQGMRSSRILGALLSIIEAQKDYPGRKCLIFLSPGFVVFGPLGQSRLGGGTLMRDIIRAANSAGVTIYSIDVAGVRGSDPDEQRQALDRAAMRSGSMVGPQSSLALAERALGSDPSANLEWLSEDTGGYTVRNDNNLILAMEKIGSFLQQYYVLTYTRSHPMNDGKFRSITVELKRKGLNVRARNGYFALPDTDRWPLYSYEAKLLEHLNADAPPADFPVYVGGYSFPEPSTAQPQACLCSFLFRSSRLKNTTTLEATWPNQRYCCW